MKNLSNINYSKGIIAENIVINYFLKNNFEIIGSRIKNKNGEIDILAKKESDFYIIEVKHRKTVISAIESINQKQIQRSVNVFFDYAEKNKLNYDQIYIKAALVSQGKLKIIDVDILEE